MSLTARVNFFFFLRRFFFILVSSYSGRIFLVCNSFIAAIDDHFFIGPVAASPIVEDVFHKFRIAAH